MANLMYKRYLKDPASLEAPAVCAASVGIAGVFFFRAFSQLLAGGKAKQ